MVLFFHLFTIAVAIYTFFVLPIQLFGSATFFLVGGIIVATILLLFGVIWVISKIQARPRKPKTRSKLASNVSEIIEVAKTSIAAKKARICPPVNFIAITSAEGGEKQ